MLKKTLVVILVFVFAATMIAGKTYALDKDYKIKRLVSQLYERRTAMDAQRQLTTYGTRVTQYVLPLLKDKSNESVRVMALRIIESIDDSRPSRRSSPV